MINITVNDTLPAYEQFGQDISIFILYTFTTVLSLFGNIIVCYVTFRKRIATTTYILIGNLALSDILGALTIPGQWLLCSYYVIEGWGERSCGLMKSSQILSYYISTLTMTVIAFDRYRIVYHPLGLRIKPWLPICLIWIISSLCILPTLISMRISEYFTPNRLIYCKVVFHSSLKVFSSSHFRRIRATFVMITQYLIPLTISIVLYGFCIKKIMYRKRIGVGTDQQLRDFYRSKRRTIKMLSISLLVFGIAWFPVHLIHMIDFYITPLLANNCNSSYYYLFFYWLAISSCCYNPYIYCWFNDDFRSAAKTSIFCGFYDCPKNMRNNEKIHSKSSPQSSNTSVFYINYMQTN